MQNAHTYLCMHRHIHTHTHTHTCTHTHTHACAHAHTHTCMRARTHARTHTHTHTHTHACTHAHTRMHTHTHTHTHSQRQALYRLTEVKCCLTLSLPGTLHHCCDALMKESHRGIQPTRNADFFNFPSPDSPRYNCNG